MKIYYRKLIFIFKVNNEKESFISTFLLGVSGMSFANSNSAELVKGPNNFVTCAKYDAMIDLMVNKGAMTYDEAAIVKCSNEIDWDGEWSVNTWGYWIHKDSETTYTLNFKGSNYEAAERFKLEIDKAISNNNQELFQIRMGRNAQFSNVVSIASVSDIRKVNDSADEDGIKYKWAVTIDTNQPINEPADNWAGSQRNFFKFKMASY